MEYQFVFDIFYILVRGNPSSLREFVSLGGFNILMDTILLDHNNERTQIHLKLKALKFMAYVWQENNLEWSDENNAMAILSSEELKKVCRFFSSDDRLYFERKYPFDEEDSLVWIEQVSEIIKTFSVPCISSWEEDNRNSKMVTWLNDSENFLRSQIQKEEEDKDIREHLEEIYNNVSDALKVRTQYWDRAETAKEEL